MNKDYKIIRRILLYEETYTHEEIFKLIYNGQIDGIRIFDSLSPMKSLDFLKNFTDLKILYINAIILEDYSFLRFMKNTIELKIGAMVNPPKELDVSNLEKMEYFEFSSYNTKIIGLKNCTNLKRVKLFEHRADKLSVLEGLNNLEKFEISTTTITSLQGIENCKKLKFLGLYYCSRLRLLTELVNLENLEEVSIHNCTKVYDFDILKHLKNLRSLEITNCKMIKSIKFIKELPNLKEVYILGNSIIEDNDLEPLSGIEKMRIQNKRRYET